MNSIGSVLDSCWALYFVRIFFLVLSLFPQHRLRASPATQIERFERDPGPLTYSA